MAGKKKIIVIDDEADLCFFIKGNLEEVGDFEVMTTTDPVNAQALCQSEKPDLILLDIVMPQIRGTDLVKTLRTSSETAKIPTVIISGLGEIVYFKKKGQWKWLPNRPVALGRGEMTREKDSQRAAKLYGVDGYIAKPFTTEGLVEVIRDVLRRVQANESGEGTGLDIYEK